MPSCTSNADSQASSNICKTISYTNTEVYCECNICGNGFHRRRLSSGKTSLSSEISVITTSLITDFADVQIQNSEKFLTTEAYTESATILFVFGGLWLSLIHI